MKIKFTALAKSQLKDIYNYYQTNASKQIATKICNKIFEKIELLKTYKEAGSEEEYLRHLNSGHRKLICGNYKIIYRIAQNIIFITDIFDSRQNPNKMNS